MTCLARQDLGPSEYSCLNLLARVFHSSCTPSEILLGKIRAPQVDAREMMKIAGRNEFRVNFSHREAYDFTIFSAENGSKKI